MTLQSPNWRIRTGSGTCAETRSDSTGWYLSVIAMNIRGTTQRAAEAALIRYVSTDFSARNGDSTRIRAGIHRYDIAMAIQTHGFKGGEVLSASL